MPSRAQFTHEDIAAVPRGYRVRTITHPSGAQVRVAFPKGPRRKGSGQLVSILHPNHGTNPQGLHLSLCTDPDISSQLNPQAISYLKAAAKASKAGKFEQAQKLFGKYTAKKRAGFRADRIERRKKKRNQPDAAKKLYRDFHGMDVHEVLVFQEALMQSGDYTALGDDPELWLTPVAGDREKWPAADIAFEPKDKVMLATDAEGRQLYFVGKNQKLEQRYLQSKGWDTSKRFVSLGEVYGISYSTEKKFDDFQNSIYAHEFGEEDGRKPLLVYDQETEKFLLIGGGYSIAPVDRSLGASPGIVN